MMRAVGRALLLALRSLSHPRMLLLMLLPVGVAVGLWLAFAAGFWTDAVTGIAHGMRRFAWMHDVMEATSMHIGPAHVVWIFAVLALIPAVLVLTVFLVGVFAMPFMLRHVAARDYADLERRRGGSFLGGAANGLAAVGWFALLALVSLPLWLIPPLWPLLGPGLLGYLNQRTFRYDALAEHASVGEFERLVREERRGLWVLGVAVALAAYIPLLGFFAPVYGGLAFIHYTLERLRAMRGASPGAGSGNEPMQESRHEPIETSCTKVTE